MLKDHKNYCSSHYDLNRFLQYHKTDYNNALSEITQGQKKSHWIWFIFPQLQGLGSSAFSKYFGIEDAAHAKAFYENNTLRLHLREITNALLLNKDKQIETIMPGIDSIKLKSSMTLFDYICPNDIFAQVLDTFYGGERDQLTLSMLGKL